MRLQRLPLRRLNPFMADTRPIGIFDSGTGGLSVYRHIRSALPAENLIYFADQAHIPYGKRSGEQVREFSEQIVRFLLALDVKLIVIACNTATVAALTYLRTQFPDTPFVGMEPAVKPAAEMTRRGKVGVLATAGTFVSQRYASLMARFAQDVVLFEDPCSGLVELVEAGKGDSAEVESLLTPILAPMLAADVDVIVLGCTHFPFVQPAIRRIVGDDVAIIDPAPAIARQVARLLQKHQLQAATTGVGQEIAFTSGDAVVFRKQTALLLGAAKPCVAVRLPIDFG